jgi:hypothetical protein
MNGYAFARSTSGGPVASWAYVNNKSETWQLSEGHRVVNVLHHNHETLGVELAGGGQEAIDADQYVAGVNTAVKFLTKYGYVEKGQSVTPIVNAVIRGHGEFTDGTHTDFNEMVMDQIRPMVIQQLVNLGYKA